MSDAPTIAVTVRNDGDVPGRFVAGLNRAAPQVAHIPVERLSVPVPAGETVVRELRDDSITAGSYPDEEVGDGKADVTYYFSGLDGRVEQDVRYVENGDGAQN